MIARVQIALATTFLFVGLAVLWTVRLCSAAQQDATPQANKNASDQNAIQALITQLGDNSFDKREAASKRLAEIAEAALPLLEKAAKDGTDVETRTRAAELVA